MPFIVSRPGIVKNDDGNGTAEVVEDLLKQDVLSALSGDTRGLYPILLPPFSDEVFSSLGKQVRVCNYYFVLLHGQLRLNNTDQNARAL